MTRKRFSGRLAGLNWRQIGQSFLLFTTAATMQAVNFNLFLAPTDTAPGGISGIAIIQLYMFIDGSIILVLGLVFGWENALYALVMLFLWGIATDYVLEGPSVVRTAFIVTDAPKAVADALLTRMGVGVTAWDGRGMFTEAAHTVLFCTISRPDVSALQAIVSQVDPAAFVVIGQGHQRSGGVLRQAALARPAAARSTRNARTAQNGQNTDATV